MKKRILCLLLVLVMVMGLLPTSALAMDETGTVRVIVENTTYSVADGAPWDGTLVDKEVSLNADSTVMTCVVGALGNYEQEGAETNYISSINGLAEMAGGSESGWMGTLNDWFTSEGLGGFSVAKGTLKSGDLIRIMYTTNGYGEDLGGSWSNNDKTLKALAFSAGTLDRDFGGEDEEPYTLTLPAGTSRLTVTPTAANKNFQVCAKRNDGSYERWGAHTFTDIQNGDVITVTCGDPAWPSMNNQAGGTAASVPAVSYTINISIPGAEPDPGSTPAVPTESVSIVMSTPGQTARLYAAEDAEKTTDLLVGVSYDKGYSVELPAGDYRLFAYSDERMDGSIKLTVTKEGRPTGLGDMTARNCFTVCTASGIYAANSGWARDVDYTVKAQVWNQAMTVDRVVGFGTDADGNLSTLCFAGDTVQITYTPDKAKRPTFAAIMTSATLNWSESSKLSAAIPEITTVAITAPKGSAVSVGSMSTYYVYTFYEQVSSDTSKADSDTFTFHVPKSMSGKAFYRVQNPGGVTYWNYVSSFSAEPITVTAADLHINDASFTKNTVYRSFEKNSYDLGDIFLNANAKGYLDLNVGGSYELNVFRNWMAIESISNAQVALPDMHYQVIDPETGAASDVLTVTPDANNSSVATVKANRQGTAAVLVTYDAMTHKQGMGGTDFSAIWPEKTGVVVFSVGQDGSAIQTNMTVNEHWGNTTDVKLAGNSIDAEHDILFFTDNKGACYSFKPEEGCTVTVARPTLGANSASYTGFSADGVSTAADGTITVSGLPAGRSIIKVSKGGVSAYQVITAAKADCTVYNEDGQLLRDAQGQWLGSVLAGDTLTLKFTGLTNPAEKQSGVYNFNANVVMTDGTNDFGVKTGGSGVYDFSGNPAARQTITFSVPADAKGSCTLMGAIGMNGFGSPTGAHRESSYAKGRNQNFTAVQVHQFLGQIQGITIPITEQHSFSVKLNITDGTKVPDQANIVLTDRDGKPVTADADGFYALQLGKYKLAVTCAGFFRLNTDFTLTEEDIARDVSGKLTLDFALTAKPADAWDGITQSEPAVDADGAYLISNGAELAWFAKKVNEEDNKVNGKLTADIELGEEPWTPIGSSSKKYAGSFDGQGHMVRNLYINGNANHQGLFGYLDGTAKVTKLGVTGSVIGKQNVGGIAGYMAAKAEVSQCFNAANITGSKWVGGIAGESLANAKITDCYNIGAVQGGSSNGWAGGITSCGIAATQCGTINNCYNVGRVSGSAYWGGINARNNATGVTNCYYLDGCTTGAKGGGTKKTAVELKALADTLGGSFSADAKSINNGYPILAWQKPAEQSAHEHTFGEPTYAWDDTNKTCTAVRACTGEDCDMSETETVNAAAGTTTAATCKEKAKTSYTAAFENTAFAAQTKVYETGELAAHNYSESITTPATCTETGVKTRTCTVCGATETEAIQALGHDYQPVADSAKAATCTVAGKNADTKCSRCQDLQTGAEVAALDHDLIHHDAKAATCAEIGWEAYDTCSRCDYTTYKEIAATGYTTALQAVLPYIKNTVTNPTVSSTSGEWAVFALNRGGAADPAWNDIYLKNLKTYVDEKNGVLHSVKYTDYSRVIIALTSMGMDASAFRTDTKTYDLVRPLLDRQSGNSALYQATWQGNNGTCFALLALDSNNYLNNADGKAARAAWIKSLQDSQFASGAWGIKADDTAPSFDITASAIYALAPYYLSKEKLDALGGSVTYAELKTMVDSALDFLSKAQSANGGFGSAEADSWVVIALASLGRDADTDPAFVKADGSLLDDLLRCFDSATGGFKHLPDGGVNQMATEQGAYGLVAYDRFKNNRNTLYDMTDTYVKSTDTGVSSVSVKGTAAAANGTAYSVELPQGTALPTASEIVLTTASEKASASTPVSADGGRTWSFTVTAEDGSTQNYTIQITFLSASTAVSSITVAGKNAASGAGRTYTVTVPYGTRVTAESFNVQVSDNGASCSVPGSTDNGSTWTFTVTAEDGSTAGYTVIVYAAVGATSTVASSIDTRYQAKIVAALNGTTVSGLSGAVSGLPTNAGLRMSVTATDVTVQNGSITELALDVTPQYSVNGGQEQKVPNGNIKGNITLTFTAPEGMAIGENTRIRHGSDYLKPVIRGRTLTITANSFSPYVIISDASIASTTYYLNGGSASGISNGTAKSYFPDEVGDSLPTPTRDGYIFDGWFDRDSTDGTEYTAVSANLPAQLYAQWSVDSSKITVTFRLIGAEKATQDVNLSNSSYLPAYVTWIPTTSYTLNKNSTVYDLFTKALSDAGLRQVGANNGYVETIYAPSSLGGYALSEFTNGTFSGWMYTVNGAHPGNSLKEQTLVNGDVVIWHYINDYRHEAADWFGDSQHPSLGNGTYYNGWLLARDVFGGTNASGGSVAEAKARMEKASFDTTMAAANTEAAVKAFVEAKLKAMNLGDVTAVVTMTSFHAATANANGSFTASVKLSKGADTATVTISGTIAREDAPLPFADVNGHWAEKAIQFVYSSKLMDGVGNNRFDPNGTVTRAMLVTVLYRMAGEPAGSGANPFADVASGQWYTKAIIWAAQNGIVDGYGNGKFGPTDKITREQMATILYRYAKQYLKNDVSRMSDISGYADAASVSSYAVNAMRWANAMKLITGRTAATLVPTGTATRGEMASILQRFLAAQ